MNIKPAHTAVRTNDLESSRQFYVDLLGFSADHEFTGGENQLLFLTLDQFCIELVYKANNANIGSNRCHQPFCLLYGLHRRRKSKTDSCRLSHHQRNSYPH